MPKSKPHSKSCAGNCKPIKNAEYLLDAHNYTSYEFDLIVNKCAQAISGDEQFGCAFDPAGYGDSHDLSGMASPAAPAHRRHDGDGRLRQQTDPSG